MNANALVRRRLLMQAAAALCGGCGGTSAPSGETCGADANGPGLAYCLVAKRKLRVPGAARFVAGQVVIMLIDDSSGVIVARDDMGFYALSATCTHACCNVNVCADSACTRAALNAAPCALPTVLTLVRPGAAFLCPCHGSQYAADGSVLSGPAHLRLPSVAMVIDGEDVVVDLSQPADPALRITG